MNPFAGYGIGFLLAVALIYCELCELYVNGLQPQTLHFILATSIGSLLIGFSYSIRGAFSYYDIPCRSRFLRVGAAVISCAYVLEIVAFGSVPLLNALAGNDSGYSRFGIPHFKVLLTAFNSFFIVYSFHTAISAKSPKDKRLAWFVCILALGWYLVIMCRGFFIFNLVACLYVYCQRMRLKLWHLLTALLLVAVVGYGFGLLGDARSVEEGGADMMVELARPTERFEQSGLPTQYLWPYVYATCSLASLDKMMDEMPSEKIGLDYFIFNYLPLTISKRFLPMEEQFLKAEPYRIAPGLTTGTVYRELYSYGGWTGTVTYYFFLMFFGCCIHLLVPKGSDMYHVAMSQLFVMMTFCCFANLFVELGYTGIFLFCMLFNRRRQV